ncbi:MAG TPA: NAD(P)/FAD-dependent oxidoreductase [Thermoanaerobaculia bacterium]|nr:NAD(P)/FAD-dependent oxidoreductase [Thermoanaerobaculia bacterium]
MKPNQRAEAKVVVVGAGMAGLCCALRLQEKKIPCVVLEASDAPGGRVRTDKVEGFLLDRGFQVLLTAYPEARRLLDYRALRLRTFAPGALIRMDGKLHRISDPFRQPWTLPATLLSPVGSLKDKMRIAHLRRHLFASSIEEIFQRPETSTLDALLELGFSDRMIGSFLRPFFGGIFLETDLATSSRMFELIFRMFSQGKAALPAAGMGAIPQQLTDRLAAGTVRLGARVEALGDGEVRLAGSERIPAAAVVLATEAPEAARLLPDLRPPGFHGTACLYFAADQAPLSKPLLVLNGEGRGPVDNLCVPSALAPGYAPAGKALVSATVVGAADADEKDLESEVRRHLVSWFGPAVQSWRHLRTYRIPLALPARSSLEPAALPVRRRPGLYLCGDHRETPSLQGAMVSGRRAADAVAEDWESRL